MAIRIPAALVSAALSSLVLAHPAAAQDAPAAGKAPLKAEVISWWTSGGEAAALKVFADRYNAAGGQWVDNAIALGENARAAAVNRIVGGNPPTAAQFNTGKQFDDIVEQGLLNDVEAVAEKGKWRDFMPPSFVEASSRDGKFYAVPINVHGQNWMFSSNAVLEKSGVTVPTTWDEMFPALDKIKAAGFIPLALGGQLWQERLLFNAVLLGKGGRDLFLKVNQDRDADALASPEFLDVMTTFGKLRTYVDPGSPGRNWNDATNLLITDKAGFQFMGDWAKGDFSNAGKEPGRDYGCALGPGDQTFMIGGDVFVMAKTDDPEQVAAQTLLAEVMLDPQTQVEFNQKKGSVPIRNDVDAASLDACAKKGLDALKSETTQVANTELLLSPDLQGAIGDVVTEFWNDPSMTPEDGAKNLADVFSSVD